MPSEVALEKSASATLMAIVIRLLVLNGSSSYIIKKVELLSLAKLFSFTFISSSSILSVVCCCAPSPLKNVLKRTGPYCKAKFNKVVRRLPSACLACNHKEHDSNEREHCWEPSSA